MFWRGFSSTWHFGKQFFVIGLLSGSNSAHNVAVDLRFSIYILRSVVRSDHDIPEDNCISMDVMMATITNRRYITTCLKMPVPISS